MGEGYFVCLLTHFVCFRQDEMPRILHNSFVGHQQSQMHELEPEPQFTNASQLNNTFGFFPKRMNRRPLP